jgi:HD superfamily phosphohydrolase
MVSRDSDKENHTTQSEKTIRLDDFYNSTSEEMKKDKKNTNLNGIYNNLLNIREVIRDPVHGDIGITLLERSLIDLEIFQRMRGISQLGPTQLVYPGAVHNRFTHSIGTLYVAEKLVDICNHNYDTINKVLEKGNIIEIDLYQHLLIRLSALLHDIAHIPFGHTLEDEGNLFPPEWEDKKRLKVFQKGKPIYECIKSVLEKFEISDDNTIVDTICKDLQNILIKGEYRDPFVVGIVSGTLCADLLDYTQRDLLFCGLAERWGDRFIKYFAVLCVKKEDSNSKDFDVYKLSTPHDGGKGRLILLAYRYEQDFERPQNMNWTQKMDVLSEAIDLLRKRFTLGEKIYFHRTKLAASSMLISAIACANLETDEIFSMNEHELIIRLSRINDRSKRLASCYTRRNLYKPIYMISFKKEDEKSNQSIELWDELYPKYRDPKNRSKTEVYLEKVMGLDPGSVSIFCPDKQMNLKKFEALVHLRPSSDIKYLRHILDPSRKDEMRVIENRFELLWKFIVFIDPKQINPLDKFDTDVIKLNDICQKCFGFTNEIDSKPKFIKENFLIDQLAAEWDKDNPDMLIPQKIIEGIKVGGDISRRPPEMKGRSNEDVLRELIEDEVTSFYKTRESV